METENINNIFITQDEKIKDTIAGKITYTDILNVIPENSYNVPNENLRKNYKTEWRWRFLKLPDDRLTIEISYITKDNVRIYFNNNGKWVERYIDPIYNNYVIKEYYYYSN